MLVKSRTTGQTYEPVGFVSEKFGKQTHWTLRVRAHGDYLTFPIMVYAFNENFDFVRSRLEKWKDATEDQRNRQTAEDIAAEAEGREPRDLL